MASASGTTTLTGTSGSDNYVGGSGNDYLSGGAGSDRLNGGSGADTLDGGSGFDTVLGGSGADTLIYRAWENQYKIGSQVYGVGTTATQTAFSGYDIYDGGNGNAAQGTAEIDRLVIYLSNAQQASSAFMTAFNNDMANFQAFIIANSNRNTGQAGQAEFTFTSINLKVSAIEQVTFAVDPTSPVGVNDTNGADVVREAGVGPGNTSFPGDSSAAGNVLLNDTDSDDGQASLVVSAVRTGPESGSGTGGTVGSALVGTYGSLTLNANGTYTYTLDNGDADTNALADGVTVTEVFTYTVRDPDGLTDTAQLTITITGTNDAPIAVADTNASDAVTEQGVNPGNTPFAGDSTAIGNVLTNDTDVDAGATKTVASVNGMVGNVGNAVTGTYGSVVINSNGSYTYTLNNADTDTQAIAQGVSVIDTFNYTVTDQFGATSATTLKITITGTNDAPIAIADTNASDSVTEQGVNPGNTPFAGDSTAIGNVLTNDTDVDAGATKTVASVNGMVGNVGNAVTGTYGSVGINSNGSFTYTLNNADADTQALAQGAAVSDVFTYTVIDQFGATSSTTLTITITGTNDSPVITTAIGGNEGTAVEAGNLDDGTVVAGDPSASGTLTSSDVDTAATATWSGAATGTYGSFAITAAGAWSYTLNNADTDTDALAEGASVTDTFTATVTDDFGATATQLVTITITGTNDSPVARADTGVVNEDATLTVTAANGVIQGTTGGSVADTDVDNATLVVSGVVAGTGAVTQGVGVGSSLAGIYGHLTLNANGSYSYVADTANSLATGVTAVDTFTYTDKDPLNAVSNTTTLQITVTGANDAPVGVNDTGSATEKGGTANGSGGSNATGNVITNDTDVDSGSLTVSAIRTGGTEGAGTAGSLGVGLVGAHGTLTIAANGSYTYVVNENDSAVQALNSGGTITDSFNYTVNDGSLTDTAVLTVTINGANDAPVGANDSGTATEKGGTANGSGGSNATGNVITNDTDVDNGSRTVSAIRTGGAEGAGTAGSLGVGLVGLHGTLTIAADGSYTYVVNENDSAVQALNTGGTITDSFNYTVSDGSLADTAVLTVTINGANDGPVNTVPGTQEVVQNTNVTFNGAQLISISDIDVGAGTETVTLSVAHGTLTLSGTTGLSFTTGDGTADTIMTFSGTVTNINNALNGLLYNPADTFVGADTLTITTTDQGGLSDSDTVTIIEESPNPGTLTTSPTDVIFYASGTNTLNGTNLTLNGTDNITGGTGTDTLIVTGGSPGPFTFGNGVGNLFLTNFEVFKLVDTNSGNHTDSVTFLSTFQNNGTLTVDATGITGNGKLNLDASGVTSGAFIVIGGESDDILKTGSGNDTIAGGTGADAINGGAGIDTIVVNAVVGASSDSTRVVQAGDDTGQDTITGFDLTSGGGETLRIVASNVNAFVHGTNTAIGTGGGAGLTSTFAISTGLVNLNNDGDVTDSSDIAVTFASPTLTLSEANFEAHLQYSLTGTGAGNTLATGILNDTIDGGGGDDGITGGAGADTMTGGAGDDTFTISSGESLAIVGGSGDAGTISGYDVITDFNPASGNDILNLPGTLGVANVAANTAGTNGATSVLTIGGATIKSHAISNGIITFDDQLGYASALNITTVAQVAAVVDYLQRQDFGAGNNVVAFTANIGGTAHTYIYDQLGATANAANDILVDLVGVTLTSGGTSLLTLINSNTVDPAGVAGSPINLAIASPSVDVDGLITAIIAGVPAGWSLNAGIDNGDGTWTVQTSDPGTLTVTTPTDFAGAVVLGVTMNWTNADGSMGGAYVSSNVEAYAQGSPIFALSSEDFLTASSGDDLLVFSQPIGHDTIYNFDTTHDQIDLIGYAGFTAFVDVQSHTINNELGDAVITLGEGQSITLHGVDANSLSADDFVFDQTPVVQNTGNMVIGDGAIMPLSGIIENTGTIELNSTGAETDLQLIQHGITLEGRGQVILSDSTENVITGTVSDVTLTNVDNTISGAGQLGAGQMILINEGTIIATGTNSLEIDTGANTIVNSGTLEATGSGGLVIDSNLDNSGLLWANGADITLNGSVTGGGSALIDGVATLEFEAASSVSVTFAAEATGTLKLGDSFDFSGIVSGFNEDDHFDLLDVTFGEGTSVSYVENSEETGGTLTVSDGIHTANISLLGDYSADGFAFSADDTTGTLLSYRHDLI
ncbi:VCBS domain-containing protein [Bradyrhizobium sp. JYMT SZCCT0428]|uniref:VCBS domain-containing protein n=1 Tax=Bradyrhizobium sp. JYMT SZCCT0428 TaxID=2807673 RepID=UPI001BAB9AFC|nr:VCBS domain-containing protein [Bradyrhizobium sp. JYMT SZCCT0428]MBR1155264.1 VCBS domain-containing protein [Bradyrhizobium sp. JYMT SZCCT0428]